MVARGLEPRIDHEVWFRGRCRHGRAGVGEHLPLPVALRDAAKHNHRLLLLLWLLRKRGLLRLTEVVVSGVTFRPWQALFSRPVSIGFHQSALSGGTHRGHFRGPRIGPQLERVVRRAAFRQRVGAGV